MTPITLVEKITLANWLAKEVLTGDQFKVAYVLFFYFHNSKTGALFPSYTQQAEAANVSKSTAIRTVKILEGVGVLAVKRTDGGRNRRNTYTLKTVSPVDPVSGNGVTSRPLAVSPADPPGVTSGPAASVTSGPAWISEFNQGKNQRMNQGRGTPAVKLPSSKRPAGSKGTRLSDSWQPSERDLAYARDLGMPDSMIQREATKFKNHWLGAPGAKGVKLNWHLTWENWCIRSIEFTASNQKARANSSSAMIAALQARGNA